MDHEVVLAFSYDEPERADRVENSLRPEVDDLANDRSHASLERTGETIRIRVRAADLVALRAGVNTWSTLVGVAEGVDGRNRA